MSTKLELKKISDTTFLKVCFHWNLFMDIPTMAYLSLQGKQQGTSTAASTIYISGSQPWSRETLGSRGKIFWVSQKDFLDLAGVLGNPSRSLNQVLLIIKNSAYHESYFPRLKEENYSFSFSLEAGVVGTRSTRRIH